MSRLSLDLPFTHAPRVSDRKSMSLNLSPTILSKGETLETYFYDKFTFSVSASNVGTYTKVVINSSFRDQLIEWLVGPLHGATLTRARRTFTVF